MPLRSSLRVLRLAAALSLLPAPALAEEPAPAQAPAAAPVTPDLKALFGRELSPLPEATLSTPGGVTGHVEAAQPVEIAAGDEGVEQLTVRLGIEQPILCTLSRGRVDAGASVVDLIQGMDGAQEIVSARPVEVFTQGGVVVVFAEVLYRQNAAQGPLAGQLKIAVHPHGAHSLVCTHDEPGYSTTFRRVVKGLAASLQGGGPDEAARARFAEVLVVRTAGLPVGYVERQLWNRPSGGRVTITYESMLLPRSEKELTTVDEFTREESDAAGLLTTVHAARALDGALDLDVQLSEGAKPRTFDYRGEKAGKPISGTFRTRDGLASELWFARQLGGKKPAKKLVHDTYSPAADPAAPTRLTFAPDPKAPGRATLTVGPMTVKGVLDGHGLLKAYDIPTAPAALQMKRVWSRGAP
jgi:hypothetical protein